MNDQTMISGLKAKDERALKAFIDVYGAVLNGVVRHTLQNHPQLWDEALNDALLAIWQHIDAFDPSRSSLKTWSANVAKYRAIDCLRREIRQEHVAVEDVSPFLSAADVVRQSEVDDLLDELLTPLSSEDRRIFKALFYDEQSYDEVARHTGLKPSQLYNRVSRGRRKIRQFRKDEMQ